MHQQRHDAELPTFNVEAERGALCSMMIRPALIDEIRTIITPNDFGMSEHRYHYNELLAMRDEGVAVEGSLLLSRLRAAGHFERAGGLTTFDAITNAVALPDNGIVFAKQIKKASRSMRLRSAIDDLARMARSGESDVELLAAVDGVLNQHGSEPDAVRAIESITLAELAVGDYTQRYLIEGVMPEGECGLVSAPFKGCKTHVTGDALVSLTTGTPFLGRFNAEGPMNTGFVSVESSKAALKEMFVRICRARGIDPTTVETLFICTECPQLPRDAGLIERFITTHDLRALVLDPAYLIMAEVAESSSNDMAMGKALRVLTEIGKRTGCTITIVTHNKKTNALNQKSFQKPTLNDVAHAGYGAWARWFLLLAPQREFDSEVGRHWLWMQTGGSAGHSDLWSLDVFEGKQHDDGGRVWEVTVSRASEAAKDREEEAERAAAEKRERTVEGHVAKLRGALKAKPEGDSCRALRIASGLNNRDFDNALGILQRLGEVEDCEILKNGKRTDAIRNRPGFSLSGTVEHSGTIRPICSGVPFECE